MVTMGLVADWAEDFGSKSKQAATKIKSIYGQHGILRRFLPKHQKKKIAMLLRLTEVRLIYPYFHPRASCERSMITRVSIRKSFMRTLSFHASATRLECSIFVRCTNPKISKTFAETKATAVKPVRSTRSRLRQSWSFPNRF